MKPQTTKYKVLAKIIPLEVISKTAALSNKLVLATSEGTYYIPIEDIIRLEADSNYSFIYTTTGKFSASRTLKTFEQELPKASFVRIHTSHLINLEHLRFRGKDFVRMSNNDEVKVSRGKSNFLK